MRAIVEVTAHSLALVTCRDPIRYHAASY